MTLILLNNREFSSSASAEASQTPYYQQQPSSANAVEYTSSSVQEHLHYTPDEGRVRCITCNTLFKNATTRLNCFQ